MEKRKKLIIWGSVLFVVVGFLLFCWGYGLSYDEGFDDGWNEGLDFGNYVNAETHLRVFNRCLEYFCSLHEGNYLKEENEDFGKCDEEWKNAKCQFTCNEIVNLGVILEK